MDDSRKKELIDYYCQDHMRKLRMICDPIIARKGIPQFECDELYSNAMEVLQETLETYDESQDCSFNTYLKKAINNHMWEWTRNKERGCRCNVERDEKGKIIRDEDSGRPIVINDISFEAPLDEGVTLADTIPSAYNLEDEVFDETEVESNEKVMYFLNQLSQIQKQILLLKMDGISADEVKEKLSLTQTEYSAEMAAIKMNENLSLFTRNKKEIDMGKMEDKSMEDTVMTINSSELYRTDKNTLYSLLESKKNRMINCKYILQRKAFQWTSEEVNRYLCRILSGLPIPEIIICEKNERGQNINYLVDGLQRLSYAEAFKENRITIGKNGAERHLVQYKEYLKDANGNRMYDEMDNPVYDVRVFELVGKKYEDLPDDLKHRFNSYNINVTKFFNCTDKQIADHLRDYNNHSSMNKEQGGMTKIGTHVARKIKTISEHNRFFKDFGAFTEANRRKGKLDRVVSEAMMLVFFKNEWKSNLGNIYQYLNTNAEDEQFERLDADLAQFAAAMEHADKELNKMFTVTTTPMWVAIFHEFIKLGVENAKFIDFVTEFNNGLKDKEVEGVKFSDFSEKQTKQKSTILGKINYIVALMKDYFGIESTITIEHDCENDSDIDLREENSNEKAYDSREESGVDGNGSDDTNGEDVLSFVRQNVNANVTEDDIDVYYDMLDGYKVDKRSALMSYENEPSLIALVAYSFDNDIDLDDWIVEFFSSHQDYIKNQTDNYNVMKNDLEAYCRKMCA